MIRLNFNLTASWADLDKVYTAYQFSIRFSLFFFIFAFHLIRTAHITITRNRVREKQRKNYKKNEEESRILQTSCKNTTMHKTKNIAKLNTRKAWCLHLHALPPWISYEYVQMSVAVAAKVDVLFSIFALWDFN